MESIERLIQEADDLPTLPDVALRVFEAVQTHQCSLVELASQIELDYALAARVLRVANSAIFGSRAPVTSVHAAVSRLGMRRTAEIVFTAAIIDVLPRHRSPLDLSRFWYFALGSGVLSRWVASDLKDEPSELAYLAGLLHSIGETVLALHFPHRYAEAWERAAAGEIELEEALMKEFGVAHPQLGARILQRWNMPAAVCEAVEWQLDPENAPRHPLLASIVLATDRLCRIAGLGLSFSYRGGRTGRPHLLEERLRQRGIDGIRSYLQRDSALLDEVAEYARAVFGGGTR